MGPPSARARRPCGPSSAAAIHFAAERVPGSSERRGTASNASAGAPGGQIDGVRSRARGGDRGRRRTGARLPRPPGHPAIGGAHRGFGLGGVGVGQHGHPQGTASASPPPAWQRPHRSTSQVLRRLSFPATDRSRMGDSGAMAPRRGKRGGRASLRIFRTGQKRHSCAPPPARSPGDRRRRFVRRGLPAGVRGACADSRSLGGPWARTPIPSPDTNGSTHASPASRADCKAARPSPPPRRSPRRQRIPRPFHRVTPAGPRPPLSPLHPRAAFDEGSAPARRGPIDLGAEGPPERGPGARVRRRRPRFRARHPGGLWGVARRGDPDVQGHTHVFPPPGGDQPGSTKPRGPGRLARVGGSCGESRPELEGGLETSSISTESSCRARAAAVAMRVAVSLVRSRSDRSIVAATQPPSA